MEHNLEQTMSLLARTPAALDVFLRGLPEVWTMRHEGDDTWSAFDVVGHLSHCERINWMPRAKAILQSGESQPFESLDRLGDVRTKQAKTLELRLDEFARLRKENLVELRVWNLQQADLERRGLHPAFGVVTLSELLATWATHDLTHLHQISRIMAHQYRDAVGPWKAYLGVLHCDGHSAP
jgi:DinB family protein